MPKLARNKHSLSHYKLATLDMGFLVPVGLMEVLPGDKFIHSSRVLLRVQPLLKPVMHPVSVRLHHWFVPNRLVWPDWDSFITRRDDQLTIPQLAVSDVARGSLADHLGLPPSSDELFDYTVSALPFRVYNAIYNHAYRDQNLISEVSLDDLALKRISWEKDIFTTARAEPQFGSAAIDIPFSPGLQAPVRGIGAWHSSSVSPTWDKTTGDIHESGGIDVTPSASDGNRYSVYNNAGGTLVYKQDASNLAYPDIYADLSAATGGGINVNDLRAGIAMQRYLEHRNRYGSRHEDYLRYLGISPSDARLQNPEYLGGGRNTISFSEVLSTADAGTSTVGDLAGHGIAALGTRKYRRFFEESGFVMSLLSIRPRTIYSQNLHRMWLRSTVFDYWQKELEAMGPQEMYTKELYAHHANATDIFGYNGRHDEYRHHPSTVAGEFRDGGTEEDWHYARDFASSPALNPSFIECAPTDRVYADTVTPEIYANVSHNVAAIRAVSRRAKH